MSYITASDESGFLHLYLCRVPLGGNEDFVQLSDNVLKSKSATRQQLTDGDWCIEYDENVSVDKANKLVYFTAYKNPLESHLFVVDYTNPSSMRQLTLDGFSHTISINNKCSLFVTVCSNLSTPYKTFIYEIVNAQNGIDKLGVRLVGQLVCRESSASVTDRLNQSPGNTGTDPMASFAKVNLNTQK